MKTFEEILNKNFFVLQGSNHRSFSTETYVKTKLLADQELNFQVYQPLILENITTRKNFYMTAQLYTVIVRVASMYLNATPSIDYPEEFFHNFSQDWFDTFLEIQHRVGHPIKAQSAEDGNTLVYLSDLHHFLENPHKDTSGLQLYLESLNNYLDLLEEDQKGNDVLIIQFYS